MKLPRDVNGEAAARALHRLGFEEMRQTGSHRIMRKEGRTVVVPMHRPIKPGTLGTDRAVRCIAGGICGGVVSQTTDPAGEAPD